ncbi:MAG: glycosyltransferase [Colwellia sp.]|nr:glycosyltransferase [Colwellia sp.]
MLINHIYYLIKPLIPRRIQIVLRRLYVWKKRPACSAVWPIDEKAGNAPEDWPGWPEGKKFALVLTHDVDTAKGHDNCRKLAELDMALGFRSCFNFVPELYTVSAELRKYLTDNGFEVGVHGLNHDGKLYRSRKIFNERALKINKYIKEWDAKGFCSPSMHNNLEWIHDLNIEYDSSTFDTDPFEPQSEGVGTIFPFLKTNRSKGNGYVELPYTLPQDFTLFIIMKEITIDIWKRKLDWIVSKGGLAQVTTHPDYMSFNGNKCIVDEYPIAYYTELLNYVKEQYKDQYWHMLPREISRFWVANSVNSLDIRVSKNNRNCKMAKVCMIVYSHYPDDVRVRREAEALIEKGFSVDVICLQSGSDKKEEVISDVTVYRLPIKRERKGKFFYMYLYFKFFMLAFFKLNVCNLKKHYNIIHIHNMPDFLVFSALIQKLMGVKIILDLHDPMPEVYMSKYYLSSNHIIIKLLIIIERLSIKFSNLTITPNIAFRDLFISRSCPENKIHIIMNSPQESIFLRKDNSTLSAVENLSNKEKFVIMFHGTIVERHGLDTALEALLLLRKQIPNIVFNVFGDGDYVDRFIELKVKYNLNDIVHYHGPVLTEKIASVIPSIDIGLIPNKRGPFTDLNMPTRIFEYLCLNKPVVVPHTKGILDYFKESEINFFEPNNPRSLANTIMNIYNNPDKSKKMVIKGRKVYSRCTWEKEQKKLVKLASRLL